jgi:RNA polymerase sigma-70 factor (ECF subfamily)
VSEGPDDLLGRQLSPQLDEASASWVSGLSCIGPERELAVDRLHALLLRIARAEAARRSGLNGITGPELDDLAHQAASDAAMSILRKVHDFRGDSKFTTWAYKFVIFEVANRFARHVWRRERTQLDEEDWDRLPGRLGTDPEDVAESRALVAAVHEAVEQELTPHQRRIFVAIALDATPLDVLVAELGSNRNAIYKTLFDARRKLRAHLAAHGYLATGSSTKLGRHG